ncbi:HAMP domain-containing sensor histidine kinase [Sporolactobacillus sp. CQH2019]|uniref:sensor histidine kinase n=1 Tax=Sporolactobacillus sp. CQH2019 TaxID=3023512 RepID=UPI002368B93A|nr:HAMP domain-containing sensor histidine kinase [Sporolactobacillus sp. CQH2019]MDD9149842.1 HAMP domain-containing sensor histidine kinase [Sporolactobacillus sp. CQH2019]
MRRQLKSSIEPQIRYEENRSKLIASISHDLKTPITSIKGYVKGFRDGVANSPEKMERYFTTIYKKSIDMDRLIDELSLYSKLDMNRLPYHFEQLDLKAFLSDLTEEIRFDLERQGVSLALHTGNGDYSVWAGREKLKRAVSNMSGNSVKYNHKKQKKFR